MEPEPDEPAPQIGEAVNDAVVAPAKVLRLTSTVDALVEEIHLTQVDARGVEQLWGRYDALLVEVGSALSDPLLEELARLLSGRTGPPGRSGRSSRSASELHVVLAQLAGWLHGLTAGLAAAEVPFVLASPIDTDAA